MDRHHEVAIGQALDQLYLEGAVSILRGHLYLWHKAKRLSKGAYRDIETRWEELCLANGHKVVPELYLLESDGPTLNIRRGLFSGEKVTPLSDWT